MKFLPHGCRYLVFPMALLAASCLDDSASGKTPQKSGPSKGSFLVSLVEPTAITKGFTSVLGGIYTGPTPGSVIWEAGAQSGACRIFTPRVPFCETPCGSEAMCVEDNKCQDYPKSLGA